MKSASSEFIFYNTDDGKAEIKLILDSETQTIWLSQLQIAELFEVSIKTANEHLIKIYREDELDEDSTIRSFRMVRQEGSREVERDVNHYNLKAILAVGYRVRSSRGTQFRRWATEHLNEYLVKGFVMNDKRLKDTSGRDYFDELLERIRDIRTSEKRFYQKIRELFSETSVDYDKKSLKAREFFSSVQNKLIFAETGHTAAELIISRADGDKPNMGLTSFDGEKVRKRDIVVAKNYLNKEEVTGLNRLVTMFLDFAEDRASNRSEISMADWALQTEKFLDFHERNVLAGVGKKSREEMETYVKSEYRKFEINRREIELSASEEEHYHELENTIKELEIKKGNNGKK